MPEDKVAHRFEHRQRLPDDTSLTLIAICILAVAGCGKGHKSQRGTSFEVSGRITVNGESLKTGTVTFVPDAAEEAGGRPGIARIESDGRYRVGNANPDKPQGLLAGHYKVTVLSMTIERDSQGRPQPRSELRERFGDWRTTPFSIVVNRDVDDANFELTNP